MRICLTTSTFPSGPGDFAHAHFLLDVIQVLREKGHDVCVLTQARDPDATPPLEGVEIVRFPWKQLGARLAELDFSSPRGMLSAASLIESGTRHVRRLRETHEIDLFLCAWVIPSGLYLLLDRVLGRSRVPYVLWALGSDLNKYKANPLVRGLIRRIGQGAGQLYADGHRLCRDFESIADRPCEFLPTFRKLTPRPRVSAQGSAARFLYVGRHTRVKGTDVLARALGELKDSDFRFEIVGDGEQTPELERVVQQAGVADRVRFSGRLSNDQLADAYANSDCVVIPSRSESIPIVMSEALQYGLPLIVTDVGDMGDLARRYRLGSVVPAEDAPALAGKIREFIAEPFRTDEALRAELLGGLTFDGAAPKLLSRFEALISA